jgi:hypothetical protein
MWEQTQEERETEMESMLIALAGAGFMTVVGYFLARG